jgi:hypothetical protein
MKKTFFAIFILIGATLSAQDRRTNNDNNQQTDNAPSNVQQSFHRDNPNVNETKWNKGNNQWHANYKDNNNRNVDTYYDPNGNRIDTHIPLDKRDVPPTVDERVNIKFNIGGNYRAAKIDRPNDQPLFEIKFHKGRRDRTIYMDEHGRKRHYRDRH